MTTVLLDKKQARPFLKHAKVFRKALQKTFELETEEKAHENKLDALKHTPVHEARSTGL